MNFLLHRHLGARDLGSAVAGAGAMLPDLWRMADRRVRPGERPSSVAASPALEHLLAGVAHHLEADRWFHADAVFLDGEREAAIALRQANITARRTVLFAHVLWELCLDGALVRREGMGEVVRAVRDGLREAGAALAEAASLHHFDRVARLAEERVAFDRRFDRICLELSRGPWIDGYRTGEGVAARIQGVRVRLGLPPMDAVDEARLARVADELLGNAVGVVERILVASPRGALT